VSIWSVLLKFGFKHGLYTYLTYLTKLAYPLAGSRIRVAGNRQASPDPVEYVPAKHRLQAAELADPAGQNQNMLRSRQSLRPASACLESKQDASGTRHMGRRFSGEENQGPISGSAKASFKPMHTPTPGQTSTANLKRVSCGQRRIWSGRYTHTTSSPAPAGMRDSAVAIP
jgi:hypothetical protein